MTSDDYDKGYRQGRTDAALEVAELREVSDPMRIYARPLVYRHEAISAAKGTS
jgi:hypothetical protein